MAESKDKVTMELQTIRDISQANQWLFNKQVNGEIDSKQIDGINTTIKAQMYLRVKLPMDYLKIIVQARIKKVDLPEEIVPDLSDLVSDKKRIEHKK